MRPAAGYTTALVPTTRKQSHAYAALAACSQTSSGSISWNQTTAGPPKVARPLSAETPAPVSTATERAVASQAAARRRASVGTSSTGGCMAAGLRGFDPGGSSVDFRPEKLYEIARVASGTRAETW